MTILNIAVAGCTGRMGKVLLEMIDEAPDLRLSAALEQNDNPFLKKDAGELIGAPCGIAISSDIASALQGSDILIDFTRPAGTLTHLALCREAGIKMVIGTTGFSAAEKEILNAASKELAIVFAPNMSVGVNVLFKLLEVAASSLLNEYDIEIVEAHHRHKKDAPSGTALRMGEVVAATLGRKLEDCAVYGREGQIGERDGKTIGFATIRAGDIVGDHTVMFATPGERVEITHKSSSRSCLPCLIQVAIAS